MISMKIILINWIKSHSIQLNSIHFASQELASQFPGTLYKFKQWLGIGDIQSRFTRKVVCPKPSCVCQQKISLRQEVCQVELC